MSHDSKLNLHQRLLKVMKEVGYVQKDVDVPGVKNNKGVARDAVVAQIRNALLANGVIASTSQVSGRYLESSQKSASGTPLTVYSGVYRTSFINVDAPAEFLTVEHEAQGNDYGDKAPGKAATYAEKLNLVKGLLLETGIADESRNPGEGDDAPVSKEVINEWKNKLTDAKTVDSLRELTVYALGAVAGDEDARKEMLAYATALSKKLAPPPPAVSMPSEKAASKPVQNPDAEGPDTDAAARRGPPASASMVKMLRSVIAGSGGKVSEDDVATQFNAKSIEAMDKVEVAAAIKFVNEAVGK